MSKQSDAKERQRWMKDPMSCATCGQCVENRKARCAFEGDTFVKVLRSCGVGGFAVKPSNSCNDWVKC